MSMITAFDTNHLESILAPEDRFLSTSNPLTLNPTNCATAVTTWMLPTSSADIKNLTCQLLSQMVPTDAQLYQRRQ